MTKLVKIVVLGFIALGISACGGISCKDGAVKDEVIKKVKTMYPNSNPKLTNIEMIDSDSEDKSVQCKADIVGVDEDRLSVKYDAHNRGDKVSVGTRIHSMIGEIRSDIVSLQRNIVTQVYANGIDTTKQKALNGKEWNEWIMESSLGSFVSEETKKAFNEKWMILGNGVSLKMCSKGETPLVSINNGYMYISPSKVAGEGKMEAFCKGLSESYRNGKSNGDKKVPLATMGTLDF
ncbi:hypothetical protein ACWIUD_08200 [Helicobacter sp. 23-1044]